MLPTAPLLLDGVSAILPDGLAAVVTALQGTLARLPQTDVVVCLAAAAEGSQHGAYASGRADLAGIGRSDLTATAVVHREAVSRITALVQYPLFGGEPLPLDLAVLVMQLQGRTPVVPIVAMSVPATAGHDVLVGVGTGIVQALEEMGLSAVVIAPGDLSAGLTEQSPLHRVEGAWLWDEQAVHAVDTGRLEGLGRLGPEEARRVGARAWAPLVVLHGACARGKVGMLVRHYSAPRGVGYLVALG